MDWHIGYKRSTFAITALIPYLQELHEALQMTGMSKYKVINLHIAHSEEVLSCFTSISQRRIPFHNKFNLDHLSLQNKSKSFSIFTDIP